MSELVEALFFDLDGTLCDTQDANFAAYERALADFGATVEREAFDAVQGTPSRSFIPALVPQLSTDDVTRVLDAKTHYYDELAWMIKPNQRLIDFLHLMRTHHTLGLVTSARRVNGLRVLAEAKIDVVFDHMVFGDDVLRGKPHPESYLRALEMSGVPAGRAIAFEDSPAGIESARAAGIMVIRV